MKKYKAIVFDMGGTLMEYEGMPMNWSGFYRSGFEKVAELNGLKIPDQCIQGNDQRRSRCKDLSH